MNLFLESRVLTYLWAGNVEKSMKQFADALRGRNTGVKSAFFAALYFELRDSIAERYTTISDAIEMYRLSQSDKAFLALYLQSTLASHPDFEKSKSQVDSDVDNFLDASEERKEYELFCDRYRCSIYRPAFGGSVFYEYSAGARIFYENANQLYSESFPLNISVGSELGNYYVAFNYGSGAFGLKENVDYSGVTWSTDDKLYNFNGVLLAAYKPYRKKQWRLLV